MRFQQPIEITRSCFDLIIVVVNLQGHVFTGNRNLVLVVELRLHDHSSVVLAQP